MVDAAGNRYYYFYDGLGSVVALSNANNVIVEAYCYDAFGQVRINVAAGQDGNWLTPEDVAAESAFGNRFMFTGREYDSETGLYHYRFRDYSPTLGRFLQPDPIGYADSMNLYAYCGNNPINFIDPWGLLAGQDPLSGDDALAQYAKMSADDVAGQSAKQCPKNLGQKIGDFFKNAWKKLRGQTDDAAKKAAELTQKEKNAIGKINNTIKDHVTPKDISGAVRDGVGNPVPKPGGGFYNHTKEINDALRGLRNQAEILKNSNSPAAIEARRKALEAIKNIEDATRGLGI